jgi:hypothetical protein
MANPFDQFDAPVAPTVPAPNPFDQFDGGPASAPTQPVANPFDKFDVKKATKEVAASLVAKLVARTAMRPPASLAELGQQLISPVKALPSAPQVPSIPELGIGNPAFAAGLYNVIKPYVEMAESPVGLASIPLGGIGGPIAARIAGLAGVGFGAPMTAQGIQEIPQTYKTLINPDTTLQQGIEAGGGNLTKLILGPLMAAKGGEAALGFTPKPAMPTLAPKPEVDVLKQSGEIAKTVQELEHQKELDYLESQAAASKARAEAESKAEMDALKLRGAALKQSLNIGQQAEKAATIPAMPTLGQPKPPTLTTIVGMLAKSESSSPYETQLRLNQVNPVPDLSAVTTPSKQAASEVAAPPAMPKLAGGVSSPPMKYTPNPEIEAARATQDAAKLTETKAVLEKPGTRSEYSVMRFTKSDGSPATMIGVEVFDGKTGEHLLSSSKENIESAGGEVPKVPKWLPANQPGERYTLDQIKAAIEKGKPNADQIEKPVGVPRNPPPRPAPQVAAGEPGELPVVPGPQGEGGGGAPAPPVPPESVMPPSAEAKFLQDTAGLPKAKPISQPPSATLGIVPPGTAAISEAGRAMIARIKETINEIRDIPRLTPFKKVTNEWFGARQQSSLAVRELTQRIEDAVPDKVAREGVIDYIQAGGDPAILRMWRDVSSNAARKAGYDRALQLTPAELKVADSARQFYTDKLAEGQKWGVLDEGLENYVNQIWKRPFVQGGGGSEFGGKMTNMFKFAKQRIFGSYFEGERSGLTPENKDIAATMAIYDDSLNKVIASKKYIKNLTTLKASDGRLLAGPVGSARVINEGIPKADDPLLIYPNARSEATADYRIVNNAALSKWKWVASEDGHPVLLNGSLGLHPEIYHHVKNILTRSAVREWYDEPGGPMAALAKSAIKTIDVLGQGTKRTMLGFLSPFHQVQLATHAILGHQVNPFWGLPDLEAASPDLIRGVNHGLALAGDNEAMSYFMEGLGGNKNIMWKIPFVGKWAQDYSTFLFHQYIPRLKLETYLHIEDRNMTRYADDIKTGKVTPDDVSYLSAQQTNAAYGHLNYTDMGRNPTLQHVLQGVLLAPDFLEARGRFAGQAARGIVSTAGREQLAALATLAATFWITARIGNKLTDDDYHWTDHPFELKVGNRWYSMRSVPEDTYNLFRDTRQFTYSRLSPIVGRGTIEMLTGRNYRGEKTPALEEAKELATRWIPIGLAALPGARELTATGHTNPVKWWEQFLGTVGLRVKRASPEYDAYNLADQWRKAQGLPENTGTYPESQYAPLKYALQDNDLTAAQSEWNKLIQATPALPGHVSPSIRLQTGFRQSVFHPWTGNATDEVNFINSLPPADKAKVQEANQLRAEVYRRFQALKIPVSSTSRPTIPAMPSLR